MKIKWLGNSSFLLKTSLSKKIFLDPFTPLELLNLNTTVDIITFSKDFHNITLSDRFVNSKILTKDEIYIDDTIKIKSYVSYSDKMKGVKRGKNFIHLLEVDDLRLCHLGYLGELPNKQILNILKKIDILFLPIGNNLCLDGLESFKLSQQLQAKYVIPMCYRCQSSDFYFDGPLDYISKVNNIFNLNSTELNTNDIPCKPYTTILMKY